MAVTVTKTTMLLYDKGYAVSVNAATADTADLAEAFTIVPTAAGHDIAIVINNAATDQGSITYSVAAGTHFGAGAALTGTIEQGTKDVLVLKSAKYKNASGAFVITVTPASGKKLLTDHTMKMECIELP